MPAVYQGTRFRHGATPIEDLQTPAAVGDALRARGARPWQVAATAQRIAAAFVEADQAVPESAESDS